MADSCKDKSSKTEDFTAKDVDDVDLLNVSFSEMELGKNIDVQYWYEYLLYGWDKCRTLIGWLPVWKKSSCPLKKFILPAQEIHLARSWKHCTNKILKETFKVY